MLNSKPSRARPLPLHVPEPQDVVAVPLDEEALHGEPLFPPELILPSEKAAEEEAKKKALQTKKPENPFDGLDANEQKDTVNWPAAKVQRQNTGSMPETLKMGDRRELGGSLL
uniref:Uncharacterized protein n=1 Tax=Caenorhabditis japonica TaxID=281687 RepID=A0A8R1EI19_CAEJA